MNPDNSTDQVSTDYIRSKYLDPIIGRDAASNLSLLSVLSRSSLGGLLETISITESCEAVAAIGFDDNAMIFDFCQRVASCINADRANQEHEGIIR